MCLVQQPELLLLDEPTAGMSRARHQPHHRSAAEDQGARHDQGHHRARHACRVLARRPRHACWRRARIIADGTPDECGRSAGAGSLSRRGASMSAIADRRQRFAAAERPPTPAGGSAVFLAAATCTPITARATSCRASASTCTEGEILALLGRNGAGKTSTLRAIARMADPQLKRARSGSAASRCTAWSRARRRGTASSLVPEDRRIIGGLTVEENLHAGADRASRAAGRSSASTSTSRGSPSGASRRRRPFPAASSRCWRSPRALARELKLLLLDEPYEGPGAGDRARDRDDPRTRSRRSASPRSSSSRTPSPRSTSPTAR